ncbi:hypothetical protein CEXT_569261 [Caerostris extrusa]|uniref:Uncharacterized protein n=1 Tax=Caerostris extrusa TaxID=172846 RepID=A0AAV4Q9W8_CAEEX|nr:hypothetical protein CEXT_569261 [Caerostris extrusa]
MLMMPATLHIPQEISPQILLTLQIPLGDRNNPAPTMHPKVITTADPKPSSLLTHINSVVESYVSFGELVNLNFSDLPSS